MEKLKSLFRKAWGLMDDDRIGLICTGIALMFAVVDFRAGHYWMFAGDLAFAAVMGVTAWCGVANDLREARG